MSGRCNRRAMLALATVLLVGAGGPASAQGAWPDIKSSLFGERELLDAKGVIRLIAPERAADAATVPITIEAELAQTPERWIKTVHLVIDENPAPVAAVFHLSREAGRASLATRVRVNAYTKVHAIAETSDGKLYVAERFVKAAGGCSAPGMKDKDEVMARLGKMKLKTVTPFIPGELMTVQLLVSHPQYTGMQMDQLTRNWIPPDYIQTFQVRFGDTPILNVVGDISLSEDPAITFSFVPTQPAALAVEVADTERRRFQQSWNLGPAS